MSGRRIAAVVIVVIAALAIVVHRHTSTPAPAPSGWYALDHVADGDTIDLRGGITVRLVQIDTPEVFFQAECYGEQASAETKRLLHPGTLVRLERDPATDAKDQYGRWLRYVILRNGMNLNVHLVVGGFAAPYFFDDVRGEYADTLLRDAEAARAAHRGLWGACPGTPLDPEHGVSTGPPQGD